MEIINIMYLFGASGHAKVIIDILNASNIGIDALIDDNENINELHNYKVLHDTTNASPVIVSIGANLIRKKIVNRLNCDFGTAIHPSAIISPTAVINEGSVVMQGAIIQSDTIIGKHCIINTRASIDHECIIDDFVHISPGAVLCGNVSVGEGTWIGAGATIVPGVKIGKWSVIGAGAVVTTSQPDNCTIVGVPAKVIKKMIKPL